MKIKDARRAGAAFFCGIYSLIAWPASDPLQHARSTQAQVSNREAVIPVQCYTKTDGVSNPCWTCHTERNGSNSMGDWALQFEYAFSEEGKTNHWANLFKDRSTEIAKISDEQVLRYIRQDNYTPLLNALKDHSDYAGWKPDLDFRKGFDKEGYARDGSWWRAFRYKPFLGTFWPTNGSTDDVMVRLPWGFYTDKAGAASREIYKINLAIVEAAVATPDTVPDDQFSRVVEPLDESLAKIDLNGDGRVGGIITRLGPLPTHYIGKASSVPVHRFVYPTGTEFLHTVRYIDPDAPSLIARRMKEVRYSVKVSYLNPKTTDFVYTQERDHKTRGLLPHFVGRKDSGLLNDFRWQLQAFIESADGQLRLQTTEEHYYCMGCHGTIGVTVDQTFGFPRKVPGIEGWAYQSLKGIKDVPQAGHAEPEILTYFKRVGGGDEFRSNEEVLARFFNGAVPIENKVRRASKGGDRDIAWLLSPSRQRALQLNKAYMALVLEQRFDLGRDTLLRPATKVHKKIENQATGFNTENGIYRDGRLWLDW